jgi:hypothetical protein
MADKMIDVIRASCMVLSLGMPSFTSRKALRAEAKKIAAENRADAAAVGASKELFRREFFKPVLLVLEEAKKQVLKTAMPYGQGGGRFLVRSIDVTDIQDVLDTAERDARAVFDSDVAPKYQAQLDAEKVKLGSLFDPDDYKSVDELRSKIRVKTEWESVADPAVLRTVADVADNEVAHLRRLVEQSTAQAVEMGTAKVMARLLDGVARLARNGSAIDMKGSSSTAVEDLEQMVSDVRAANLAHDEFLDGACDAVEALLAGETTARLKGDAHRARAIGEEATDVAEAIAVEVTRRGADVGMSAAQNMDEARAAIVTRAGQSPAPAAKPAPVTASRPVVTRGGTVNAFAAFHAAKAAPTVIRRPGEVEAKQHREVTPGHATDYGKIKARPTGKGKRRRGKRGGRKHKKINV